MHSKLTASWLKRLANVESQNITYASEQFPIVMHKARGMFVSDVDGKRYRDFTACFGVLAFGHRPPVTLNALRKQSAKLIHGMGDVHPSTSKILFLETLAKFSPFKSAKIILSSSGADAVESALKTAIVATKRHRFLSFEGGYHGLHMGAMGLSGNSFFTHGFENFVGDRNVVLPFPDNINISESQILSKLEDQLKSSQFAALVMELIQGRGGEQSFSQSFVKSVRKLTTHYKTILIFDEVYTGLYRTGKRFACEHVEVVPDLLCIGKALGGGLPLSACLGEDTLIDCWGQTRGEARHTSTFLGHPLACAVGHAILVKLKKHEHKIQKAAELSHQWLSDFSTRYHETENGKKVPFKLRGRGFMHGLWFYKSRPGFAAMLMEKLLSKGFIVLPSAADATVLSLSPPFIASQTDYAALFVAIEKSVSELLSVRS